MAAPRLSVKGLVVAPCTPFTADDDVNPDVIPRYIDHLVTEGVRNVFVNGTLGEAINMTLEERKKMAEAWVKAGKDRLDCIIVHVGAGNYKDSQQLAEHAQGIGASAVSCVGPSYYHPHTVDSYVDYMAKVASAAPQMPFLLYDFDIMTKIRYSGIEFFRAARGRIPTLAGVKHTSANFPSVHRILAEFPDMCMLLGSEVSFLDAFAIGVRSSIVTSDAVQLLSAVQQAFERGDLSAARQLQRKVLQLDDIRTGTGHHLISITKAMLTLRGVAMGNPRLPLVPLPSELAQKVKVDMEVLGIGFSE